MKKLIILALAVVMAGTVAACGMDVGGTPSGSASSASSQAVSKPSTESYDDNLAGLEKYLSANSVISGNPTKMQADFIGAKSGDKYQASFNGNNNVTVELYEFDPSNLNDTAKQVIGSVKKSGSFNIMDRDVPAVLSANEKYLMIYRDSNTADQNKAHEKDAAKLFQEFKK
jgi:hypothetical protein